MIEGNGEKMGDGMSEESEGGDADLNPSLTDDKDFAERRADARKRLNVLVGSESDVPGDRKTWFENVYDFADGDPAAVPWADLAPKPALMQWLANNPADVGRGARALDIACGLGDNAEALSDAGYQTTAFDLAAGAIQWARKRFPESSVDYQVGDLFDPPSDWFGAFDLVHEYYTIQALSGDLRTSAYSAIGKLVAPGGLLLVVCRSRENGAEVDGPPWPLSRDELSAFDNLGLERISQKSFFVESPDRRIPHLETLYRKHR